MRGRRFLPLLLLLMPLAFRDEVSAAALVRVVALALAATGVSLVSGIAGQISLGHAALMGAGAFTSAGLAVHAGWPVGLAWIAGTLLAGLLGAALGVPALRLRGQYLALATLGAGVIVFQVAREASSLTGGELGLPGVPFAAGATVTAFLGCALLAAALIGVAFVEHAVPGLRMRAVRDSEPGAEASGVNLTRTKLIAFLASALMAGCAGALFAHSEGFIAVGAFDPAKSFALILAAVLGGLRSPYGGALGAFVIFGPAELAPGAFSWLAEYQLIAWGPVALLVVFKFPDGITGLAARWGKASRGPLARMDPSVQSGERVANGSPPNAPALEARGITVRFGGLVALSDVDLSVTPGTIHALIGPNGSGKTTLVDCLTGFRRPNAGRVSLGGRDVTSSTPDRIARLGVGRTFQTVALFGTMTCLENLGVAQASRGLLDRPRTAELLAMTGLTGFEETVAAELSYGQRKRLELARALALGPDILVLDEPAAGRNEPEILELGRLLKRLRVGGLTILVVEHHMNFVLAFADVVTALDEGRVIAHGPPSAVRADERVIEAYLGASA
jgi:branched-chain amino acid transport system ATP-binding protein/branched-chain amino acid transport system permease protein